MGRRAFYAEGTLAERPPARREGLMYYAEDEGVTYLDDGAAWVPLQAAQDLPPGDIVWDQFVPGTLSARNPISVIANPIQAQVVLRYLEVNFGIAPSTVDASNNLVLDVFGSISGLAELPLDVNGQSRFALDEESPVALVEANSPDPLDAAPATCVAQRIQPSSDVTISSVGVFLWRDQSNTPMTGVNKRAVVLDAARSQYLAVSDWSTVGWPGGDWLDRTLQESVDLAAGTNYYLGFETQNNSSNWNYGKQQTEGYTGASDTGVGALRIVSEAGTLLDDGSGTADQRTDRACFRAKGTPTGILIDGDINLALSSIGTPGANPGADLNITLRAELPA